MRFIRLSDYNEIFLKREHKEELIYSQEAIKVLKDSKINKSQLKSTFANLYDFSRKYEYPFFRSIIENLSKKKSNLSILDIGCGSVYAPFSFSKSASSYVGIDLLDLKEFYKKLCNRIEFAQHDITKSPYKVAEFDLAISISVLEHIPQELRIKAFDNIASSLKKGGIFAFTFDVDLEAIGVGFTFDQIYETIYHLKEIGMESSEEIDLTLYDDILTNEELIDLPKNRYQLPWRLKRKELKNASLAVVSGCFRRQ